MWHLNNVFWAVVLGTFWCPFMCLVKPWDDVHILHSFQIKLVGCCLYASSFYLCLWTEVWLTKPAFDRNTQVQMLQARPCRSVCNAGFEGHFRVYSDPHIPVQMLCFLHEWVYTALNGQLHGSLILTIFSLQVILGDIFEMFSRPMLESLPVVCSP